MISRKPPILIAIILTGIAFLYVPSIVFAGTGVADSQNINTKVTNCEETRTCKATSVSSKFAAFGYCDYISAGRSVALFIPGGSQGEYRSFRNWALRQSSDVLTFNDCVNGAWSAWSACSTSCGVGYKTRTCDYPNAYRGNDCSALDGGDSVRSCSEYSGCSYYPTAYNACPSNCGQAASYVGPSSCTRSDGTAGFPASYCAGYSQYCGATAACVVCPAYSTWNGSSCACNSGYVPELQCTRWAYTPKYGVDCDQCPPQFTGCKPGKCWCTPSLPGYGYMEARCDVNKQARSYCAEVGLGCRQLTPCEINPALPECYSPPWEAPG